MIEVEVENRSGVEVDAAGAVDLARRALAHEGVTATDVLSFPIDGLDELPEGVPRALGDVVVCPQIVGDEWRWPLVHGILHLLGFDHGEAMEAREREILEEAG